MKTPGLYLKSSQSIFLFGIVALLGNQAFAMSGAKPTPAASPSPSPKVSVKPTTKPQPLPSVTPTGPDPFFSQQWSLHNDGTQTVSIDVDDLHTVEQKGVAGVDIGWQAAQAEVTALAVNPVTVAVIDSGVDTKNPDLQGRLVAGYDFLDHALMQDGMGHGTHVSGIIAAAANNGTGIAGVAPAMIKVMPLKILVANYTGFTYHGKLVSDYAADAIRYAVANHVSVINMSLGWPEIVDTPNAREAVQEAVAAGTLIVVAAGNDRKNEPTYPCNYEGVLCVGSVTNNGQPALYSNSGGSVDLLAPGDGIISTYPLNVESKVLRIQGFEMLSGTSQASPMVAGIAAVLKSINPNITASELKARLFASASALPNADASLYGLVNMKKAIDAKAQSIFQPDFKMTDLIAINEEEASSLQIQGNVSVQNLWLAAQDVKTEVLINGKSVGSANSPLLAQGASLTTPWTFSFSSLDDSSSLELTLRVTDAAGDSQEFSQTLSAVRPLDKIQSNKSMPIAGANPPIDWVGSTNGHLYSKLRTVNSYTPEPGFPRYYQQLSSDGKSSVVRIFDPSQGDTLASVVVPNISSISSVFRIDSNGDGKMNYVITGVDNPAKPTYFQFYFVDTNLKPLWSDASHSTWQIPLDPIFGGVIQRAYAAPGSWVKGADGKLVPCFLATGSLPPKDNFDTLDARHYSGDNHLFYLGQSAAANAVAVPLEVRALDGATYRANLENLHLIGLVPPNAADSKSGHLRILAASGTDLSAVSELWDIQSLTDHSMQTASGWSAVSSSGQAALDATGTSAAFISFFDTARGIISWASPTGVFSETSEFSFSSPENPLTQVIGTFDLGAKGRFSFFFSNFDLIGFHDFAGKPGSQEMRTTGLGKDSSFPIQQSKEMYAAVIVGQPGDETPGIYIDSTPVRGNHLAVATWSDSASTLVKPLRYSMQVPTNCLQLDPVQMTPDPTSFGVPMICETLDAKGAIQGLTYEVVMPKGT